MFVKQQLEKLAGNSRWAIELIDIYQSQKDKMHRNLTFRLEIASYERTMTSDEVNALLDKVSAEAGKQFKAARI